MPKKLAIFASGSGSNAENICNYFTNHSDIEVILICTNKRDAFIVKRAEKLNIPVIFITKTELNNFNGLHKKLQKAKIDVIILAGFLLKLPAVMVEKYPNRILNIHPSLLPKYKGLNTHQKTIENNEKFSGCTVHYVTSKLDSGKIIIQKKIKIRKNDTPKSLSKRILHQEHKLYPKAIMKIFNL